MSNSNDFLQSLSPQDLCNIAAHFSGLSVSPYPSKSGATSPYPLVLARAWKSVKEGECWLLAVGTVHERPEGHGAGMMQTGMAGESLRSAS